MNKLTVISTTQEIDRFLNGLDIPKETRIASVVGYLSESVILEGVLNEWEDRLDLIICMLKNRTNEYNNLLKQ